MNFTKACWKITFWRIVDKYTLISGAAFAALFFLAACDKPTAFTLQTSLPASHFNVKDTILPLFLQTQYLDSLRSNNLSGDMAGSFNDPELGASDARLFFELRLQTLLISAPVSPVVDSAFLYMVYGDSSQQTGNFNDAQSWNFYPLQGNIDGSVAYYTNSTSLVPNTAVKIANYKGSFSKTDSTLKIPFNSAYALRMLTSGSVILGDDVSFLDTFPGVALIPDHSAINGKTGGIINFNLSDARSKLVIYYRSSGTSTEDTFILNAVDAYRVNTYSHNYSSKVTSIINKSGQTKVYLQDTGGLKSRVDLPDLSWMMNNGTTAINEAELVFPETTTGNGGYIREPSQLYLYPRAIDGTNESLNSDFNQGFIDGTYGDYGGTWRPSQRSYSFILTHHIQNVIDRFRKMPNYNKPGGLQYQGLNLFIPSDNPLTSNRIILQNTNSLNIKSGPYLRIIYTKIPEH